MQTNYILHTVLISWIMLLGTQVLLGCSSQEFLVPTPTIGITEQVGVQPSEGSASYHTANSLQELVSNSNAIVIGRMTGTGETINLARDMNDITKPDPKLLIVGQVYHFAVERYIKGTGSKTLDIIQPEAFLTERDSKTPADIERARRQYKYIPLRPETKYIYFLRALQGFPGKNYFVGTAHPWRFTLPDTGNAEPESPWEYAFKVFPPRPTAGLIGEVEQIVSGAKITPTPTTRPYPLSNR